MTAIVESIEIGRTPEDVFGYIDELDRHPEWQQELLSSRTVTDGPTRVGSQVTDCRRMAGGMKVDSTYEIVEHDPPHRSRFQVLNGPVRATGTITVQPLDGGARARLTLELDFQGHGLGRLMAPVARRRAARQVPIDQRRLKQLLETGS